MKKIISAFVLFSFLSVISSAQVSVTVTDGGAKPPIGTYQFIYKDRTSDQSIVLSDSQLEHLESLRDDSKTIYVSFSELTTIKLPSKQAITDPAFVPLTNKIFIKEESNYQDYYNLNLVPFQ